MNPDDAIALSFLTDLPRLALTACLYADDPELLERAESVRSIEQDVRGRAASVGIEAIAWNDPRFPAQLLAIADCPPALWCRGSLECLGASDHAAPSAFLPVKQPKTWLHLYQGEL